MRAIRFAAAFRSSLQYTPQGRIPMPSATGDRTGNWQWRDAHAVRSPAGRRIGRQEALATGDLKTRATHHQHASTRKRG